MSLQEMYHEVRGFPGLPVGGVVSELRISRIITSWRSGLRDVVSRSCPKSEILDITELDLLRIFFGVNAQVSLWRSSRGTLPDGLDGGG